MNETTWDGIQTVMIATFLCLPAYLLCEYVCIVNARLWGFEQWSVWTPDAEKFCFRALHHMLECWIGKCVSYELSVLGYLSPSSSHQV